MVFYGFSVVFQSRKAFFMVKMAKKGFFMVFYGPKAIFMVFYGFLWFAEALPDGQTLRYLESFFYNGFKDGLFCHQLEYFVATCCAHLVQIHTCIQEPLLYTSLWKAYAMCFTIKYSFCIFCQKKVVFLGRN